MKILVEKILKYDEKNNTVGNNADKFFPYRVSLIPHIIFNLGLVWEKLTLKSPRQSYFFETVNELIIISL